MPIRNPISQLFRKCSFLMEAAQQMDISPIVEDCDSDKGGQPPYHPRRVLVLLRYAYCVGVFSWRKILARCETRLQKIRAANAALQEQARQKAAADAGYFSEDNMTSLETNERINEAYIATGRSKRHEPVPAVPRVRPPKDLSAKERMARKLRTKKGRAEYARRKAIVAPPFGQIKHGRGFRQFLLRGLQSMRGEWTLVCLTRHRLKLFRHGALTIG